MSLDGERFLRYHSTSLTSMYLPWSFYWTILICIYHQAWQWADIYPILLSHKAKNKLFLFQYQCLVKWIFALFMYIPWSEASQVSCSLVKRLVKRHWFELSSYSSLSDTKIVYSKCYTTVCYWYNWYYWYYQYYRYYHLLATLRSLRGRTTP